MLRISTDILSGVADDSKRVSPRAGRLTDHVTIGVLSGLIHRDVVDDVIRESGKREARTRLLPAHVVVYYVLALNLFFGQAYEEVMRQLVGGLQFLGNWRDNWTVPSTAAISQARTRLGEQGEQPLKLLFERIAVPMARAGTRGAWFHELRVMAIDGLVSMCRTPQKTWTPSAARATPTRPAPSPKSGWSRWASAAPTASVLLAILPVVMANASRLTPSTPPDRPERGEVEHAGQPGDPRAALLPATPIGAQARPGPRLKLSIVGPDRQLGDPAWSSPPVARVVPAEAFVASEVVLKVVPAVVPDPRGVSEARRRPRRPGSLGGRERRAPGPTLSHPA